MKQRWIFLIQFTKYAASDNSECCLLHIFWCLLVSFFSGASFSYTVRQIPTDIYKHPGEIAKFRCVHSIPIYNQIIWYKRSTTGQFQLLGYMVAGNVFPEAGVSVKMDGSANTNKTSTLTIAGLSLDSSAEYFCAASSHSAIYRCSSAQKPPRHTVYVCL